MQSRERVWRALTRQGMPDRIPLQFDLSRQLLERFSVKHGIPVHYTQSYYEDLTYRLSGNELRVAMGSDCIIVGAGLPRGYGHPVEGETLVNEFGMKMRQGPLYMEVVEHPLADLTDPKQVEDFFPDPLAEGRFDDAAMYIRKYKGEFFIWGDIELTLFGMMRNLVGMEKLLMDMALDAAYIPVLAEAVMEFSLAIGKQLIALGVDGIWGGDDYGAQDRMLMSPEMWRRYFKERYRKLHGAFLALNPALVLAHHCDGAVAPILDDWIEVGLQVFNPVQPNVPGHDPRSLKARFGDRLSFWGAIDQQQLLPFGTVHEIEAAVKHVAETLGAGGGFMVAPAHIIQPDTPMENVEAFIDAVKKHCIYA